MIPNMPWFMENVRSLATDPTELKALIRHAETTRTEGDRGRTLAITLLNACARDRELQFCVVSEAYFGKGHRRGWSAGTVTLAAVSDVIRDYIDNIER